MKKLLVLAMLATGLASCGQKEAERRNKNRSCSKRILLSMQKHTAIAQKLINVQ
jgi:hypothetical protein